MALSLPLIGDFVQLFSLLTSKIFISAKKFLHQNFRSSGVLEITDVHGANVLQFYAVCSFPSLLTPFGFGYKNQSVKTVERNNQINALC